MKVCKGCTFPRHFCLVPRRARMGSDPGLHMFPFDVFPTRRDTRTTMVCPKRPRGRLLIGQNRCAVCTGPRELILPFFVPDDTRCAPNALSKCQGLHIHTEGRPGMGIISPCPRNGAQEGLKGASSVENLQGYGGKTADRASKTGCKWGKRGMRPWKNAMGRPFIHLRQA